MREYAQEMHNSRWNYTTHLRSIRGSRIPLGHTPRGSVIKPNGTLVSKTQQLPRRQLFPEMDTQNTGIENIEANLLRFA